MISILVLKRTSGAKIEVSIFGIGIIFGWHYTYHRANTTILQTYYYFNTLIRNPTLPNDHIFIQWVNAAIILVTLDFILV